MYSNAAVHTGVGVLELSSVQLMRCEHVRARARSCWSMSVSRCSSICRHIAAGDQCQRQLDHPQNFTERQFTDSFPV